MSDLLGRLGAVATGDGVLSVPRARARFEPLTVEPLDVIGEADGDGDGTGGAVVAAARGPVWPGGGDGVGRQRTGPSAGADTHVPAGPEHESRPTPSPPPGLVSPVGVASAGAPPVGKAPRLPVPVGDEAPAVPEHRRGVVDPGEVLAPGGPDVVLAELLAWIDDAVERRLDAGSDAASPEADRTDALVAAPTRAAVMAAPIAETGARGEAPAAATGPVVSIGRVEVRVVPPAPPAARPLAVRSEPEPLHYAGPTLEEYLGGRR